MLPRSLDASSHTGEGCAYELVGRGLTAARRTLRDDDDSGAPWTRGFIQGAFVAPAALHGAKLFQEPGKAYPFVVLSDDADARVLGRLFWWPTEAEFAVQLAFADDIEEYEPDGSGLYDRGIARVEVLGAPVAMGGGSAPAIEGADDAGCVLAGFYFQKHVPPGSVAIPGGDWLLRAR